MKNRRGLNCSSFEEPELDEDACTFDERNADISKELQQGSPNSCEEPLVSFADNQPYKMSFCTGGLFLNESVEVARLRRPNEDWEATILRALARSTTSLPKSASNRRTIREIVNRISTLADHELEFLVGEADRTDRQAILWLTTCRAYRFIREFAIEVIRERYLSYHLELPRESFDIFYNAKAEWDDGLSSLSSKTQLKLRQVMFRIMREASVINDDNRIQKSILSVRLRTLIEEQNPAQLVVFPGMTPNGAT